MAVVLVIAANKCDIPIWLCWSCTANRRATANTSSTGSGVGAVIPIIPIDSRILRVRRPTQYLSFAKNASAGIALRCRTFVTVMQAAEVRNLDDGSDTRDLPNMRTLLVES